MTYAELLARLLPARRFGVVFGLERMRGLLDQLGAPDRRMGRVVHVGGTNGKGSTVAMIAALARATGLRVATYTSPHLSCLRERIAFDDGMITEAEIVDAAKDVPDDYTFFEQLTAIACVAIAARKVDLTVLEVGLGGRLDSTNAVAAEVAVVTGVAMDHEAILGDTIEAIAGEKAGIFKPGQLAVIGASGLPAALPVLRAAAPHAVVVDEDRLARVPPLSLPGAHQRANAAAAIAAIELLQLPIVDDALAHVVHPGRMEQAGDVLLDGAHNPHGATALAAAVGRPAAIIIGCSADKDIAGIAAALARIAGAVIATRYLQDRALDPAALAAHFANARTAATLTDALAIARTTDLPVVVCGSLFLVGEARVLLLGAPADPVWVSDPPAAPGR